MAIEFIFFFWWILAHENAAGSRHSHGRHGQLSPSVVSHLDTLWL